MPTYACLCRDVDVEVRGQLAEACFLLPLHVFWGSNSGHQGPFLAEPSYPPSFFLGLNNILCLYTYLVCTPVLCWWTFEPFPSAGYYGHAVNTGIWVSVWVLVFRPLWVDVKNRISSFRGGCALRLYGTVTHSSCTGLYSHCQHRRALFSTSLPTRLFSSSQSTVCEMTACGFALCLPTDRASFHVVHGHLFIFFGDISAPALRPLLSWVVYTAVCWLTTDCK